MSTSRTARRPTSVAPAIAIATLRFARFGLGRAAFAFLALTTTYLIKLNLYTAPPAPPARALRLPFNRGAVKP